MKIYFLLKLVIFHPAMFPSKIEWDHTKGPRFGSYDRGGMRYSGWTGSVHWVRPLEISWNVRLPETNQFAGCFAVTRWEPQLGSPILPRRREDANPPGMMKDAIPQKNDTLNNPLCGQLFLNIKSQLLDVVCPFFMNCFTLYLRNPFLHFQE